MEIKNAALIASLVSLFSILIAAKTLSRGLWSATGISILLLNLFHLGIFPELIFRDDSTSIIVNRWLHISPTVNASFLASSGILAFLTGSLLIAPKDSHLTRNRLNKSDFASRKQSYRPTRVIRVLGLVGSGLTILGCVAWMRFAVNSGITFSSSYVDYLNSQASEPYLQLIYYGIGLGLVFSCVDPVSKVPRLAFLVFFIFAIWGFPVGLRGEVLFPLASAVSVLAVRFRMPRTTPSLLVAGIILMLIAAISISRQEGIDKLGDLSTYSPLAALAELGSSIRVLIVMSEWHPPGSVDWAGIGPYLNPTLDAIVRLVFRSAPNPQHIDTYVSSQIAASVGQIGGSVIASAFHSFGSFGMIALMFCWGLLLSRLELLAFNNFYMLAVMGGVTFAFQQQIRNDFASMPVIMIMLMVLLLISWLIDIIMPKKIINRFKAKDASQYEKV